jgi:hypothetical protein
MTHQLEISGFFIRQIGTLTAVRRGATAVGQRGWIFDERALALGNYSNSTIT